MEKEILRSDSYACISMGETYLDLGRYEEALKWYKKAIAIDDSNADAAFGMGESYHNISDYTNANLYYNKALKRYEAKIKDGENDDKSYTNLGNIYKKFKKYDDAIDCYKKAIEIDPDNNDAKNNMEKLQKILLKKSINETRVIKKIVSDEKTEDFFSDTEKKDAKAETLEQLLAELDSFTGLNEVKKEIITFVNFIEVQNSRSDLGLKTSPVSYHMVFMGNPGTGKTSIAQILGKIYKHLNILPSGHLIEADVSGLVGEHSGLSAQKVNKIIDDAIGGILFVEDAVSLTKSKNEFGKEAISALIKRMDVEKEKFAVILAGYPTEMTNFLEDNPSLGSRFNRHIEFPDYTPNELLKIFIKNCVELEYDLTENATLILMDLFKTIYATRDRSFGNAIFVRNILEKTIERQANRVVKFSKLTKAILTTIEQEDIPINY